MIEIKSTYEGSLRCSSRHGPSGTVIVTDAPVDNHGKGESFSPTDLVATALGSCILTTMGIVATMIKVDLSGAQVTVHKEMTSQPPRRIAALIVTVTIPIELNEVQKQKLMKGALGCPVHASLHPDIQAPIEFIWA